MSNLTPKEKAKELVDKFYQYANEEFDDKLNEYPGQVLSERRKMRKESSKQCAFIAVDEILNVIDNFEMIYWENVKQEIELL
jgi:ABC-type transporter MlaC component